MEDKLKNLYNECTQELKTIGIDIQNNNIGKIDISLAKRKNKRYGCCKQEDPDKKSKHIEKRRYSKVIIYDRFNKHHIEVSKWVMELNNEIIKNTIIHEIIHCFPYCNNHGEEFKKYAKYINLKLGYNISRLGDKKKDFESSNIKYEEKTDYKYKIQCNQCGQVFYRKRMNKNLTKKYRCGKCSGKLEVINI